VAADLGCGDAYQCLVFAELVRSDATLCSVEGPMVVENIGCLWSKVPEWLTFARNRGVGAFGLIRSFGSASLGASSVHRDMASVFKVPIVFFFWLPRNPDYSVLIINNLTPVNVGGTIYTLPANSKLGK
jgi:hypothetical protein